MKTLLLIGVFQAFFLAFLVLRKKPKALADYILAGWLVWLGLFIGGYAFYSEDLFLRLPHLISSYISLFLLQGPFLYFYTLSLMGGRRKVCSPVQIIHLLPFVLFNLYLAVAFRMPEVAGNIRLDYISSGVRLPFLFSVFLFAVFLSGPAYVALTLQMLHAHQVNVLNSFSYTEKVNLAWLRRLVYSFGLIWTILILVAVIHHLMFLFTRDFCTNGLFLSLSVFVILIGYFGLEQSVIVTPSLKGEKEPENPVRYAGSSLKKEVVPELAEKLRDFMEKEKPFTDGTLSLQQLSGLTGIPVHQLSQVINEHFGQNFFDFINTYRVNEVIRKMDAPGFENYSLLGLAFDSGFNSKTAFNRFFKKITGVTPSEYKKGGREKSTL